MLGKTKKKEYICTSNHLSFAIYLLICIRYDGEVLEWLKRHAWKACIRQKRITGSNPVLSATKT